MPEVREKLAQLDDPEIEDMYLTYLDQLMAKLQVNSLALDMPDVMHLKAEDKLRVKDEEVTMVDDTLKEQTEESYKEQTMQQTEETYKEVRAMKLKRKHNLEGDGTGAREPKVASSSTSGVGQRSEGSSTLAHQK